MNKLLIVDLDGTIRKAKSGAEFINTPEDQEPIEGAIAALDRYLEKGYKIVGATNQGGVEAGYKTLEECQLEQNIALNMFPQLSAILYCPDMQGDRCLCIWRTKESEGDQWVCHYLLREDVEVAEKLSPALRGSYRKPGVGMLLKAIAMAGASVKTTIMVGDRPEDYHAANKLGCQFIWAEYWLKGEDE